HADPDREARTDLDAEILDSGDALDDRTHDDAHRTARSRKRKTSRARLCLASRTIAAERESRRFTRRLPDKQSSDNRSDTRFGGTMVLSRLIRSASKLFPAPATG